MPKVLVIQHAAGEGLGTFAEEMAAYGLEPVFLKTWEDPVFPSPSQLAGYGALLSLGGPMSATDEKNHPWMTKELYVFDEALRQKKPILGICLGAQLLAKAAGGRVYTAKQGEIGWFPIYYDEWFSKRNPLFFQLELDRPMTVFHWHFDSFDLPTEAYRLAWSDRTENQAFVFQGNAVGLQYHLEMTEPMIRDWLTSEASRNHILEAGFDPDEILRQSPEPLKALRDKAHKVFYGFASLIRDNVRRSIAG